MLVLSLYKSVAWFAEAKHLMGLPSGWDLPGFRVAEKIRVVGNGVPLAMGRAVAQAVRRAMADQHQPAAE